MVIKIIWLLYSWLYFDTACLYVLDEKLCFNFFLLIIINTYVGAIINIENTVRGIGIIKCCGSMNADTILKGITNSYLIWNNSGRELRQNNHDYPAIPAQIGALDLREINMKGVCSWKAESCCVVGIICWSSHVGRRPRGPYCCASRF